MGITKTAYEKTKKEYNDCVVYLGRPRAKELADESVEKLSTIAFFLMDAGKTSLAEFVLRKCNQILIMYGEPPAFWDSKSRVLK